MSSVITFYICTKWIKFTQLFILGFISSSLYLEDMSRERKHWLQQFHMIFVYCVWCHLWVSASFGHNSGRLACSLVKQLHLCPQALADSSQSKKHIGRPLYKAQGKLHTFIKRLSSRCIKCLPGFAGVDCVCIRHDWPFATADDANKMIPTTVLAHQRATRVLLRENIKIHPITSTCGQAQRIMIIDRTKSNLWLF